MIVHNKQKKDELTNTEKKEKKEREKEFEK